MRDYAAALLAASFVACTPPAATPTPPVTPAKPAAAVPEWLRGTWIRNSVVTPGEPWPAMLVHYVQTDGLFGDVRVLTDRSAIGGATSFADLSDEQLKRMVWQTGFIGAASVTGDRSTWQHELDFHSSTKPDSASVSNVANRMEERAFDGSFVEHWFRITPADGRFLVARVDTDGALVRALVVAGDHFVYGRARRTPLPAGTSLFAFIESDAPREAKIAALDAEFSYGTIRGGALPWQIMYSTLPWREGTTVEALADFTVDASGALTAAAPWRITSNTFAADDLRVLFDRGRRR